MQIVLLIELCWLPMPLGNCARVQNKGFKHEVLLFLNFWPSEAGL